jgi:hypothetical protein
MCNLYLDELHTLRKMGVLTEKHGSESALCVVLTLVIGAESTYR